jgi:PPOX class probable F420-dependent enzyme
MSTVPLDPRELAFLIAARYAILATVDPKGTPRAIPVCFIAKSDNSGGLEVLTPLDDKPKSVEDKHGLARVRDIERQHDVSLLVEHWNEDWSKLGWLRLYGYATVLDPDDWSHVYAEAVERLRAKYPQYATHDLESSPMIVINVERATTWGNLDPD